MTEPERDERARAREPFVTGAQVMAGLARIVDLALDGGDLTLAQYRILGYLLRRPSIPSHLAAWLGVRKQSITSLMDGLARRDLVERQDVAEDRRRVMFIVTDKGRQAVQRAEIRIQTVLDATLQQLDDPALVGEATRGLEVVGIALARALDFAQHNVADREELERLLVERTRALDT